MPGTTESLTYEYSLDNGQSATATASFQVNGPTATGANSTFFTAVPGTVNVWPSGEAFGGTGAWPSLEFGDVTPNHGMTFTVAANLPTNQGTFQWVQLINNAQVQEVSNPSQSPTNYGTGLDNFYPYVTLSGNSNTTNDSPGTQLSQTGLVELGELATQFNATMYLLWDPSLSAGGTPAPGCAASTIQTGKTIASTASTCTGSIPIPLGAVSWGFSACAINTLSSQDSTLTTWLLQCPTSPPTAPTVQSSSSYPQWSNNLQNGNL